MRGFNLCLDSNLRLVLKFCHSSLLDWFFRFLLYRLLIHLRRIDWSCLLLILLLTWWICCLRISPSLWRSLTRECYWGCSWSWWFRESCWDSCWYRSISRMLISCCLLGCWVAISCCWCLVSIWLRLCCSLISRISILCLRCCISRSRRRWRSWGSNLRRRRKSCWLKRRVSIEQFLNVIIQPK